MLVHRGSTSAVIIKMIFSIRGASFIYISVNETKLGSCMVLSLASVNPLWTKYINKTTVISHQCLDYNCLKLRCDYGSFRCDISSCGHSLSVWIGHQIQDILEQFSCVVDSAVRLDKDVKWLQANVLPNSVCELSYLIISIKSLAS